MGEYTHPTWLVAQADKLFADAADGKLEDKKLAERINAWLPSNLRGEEAKERESVKD